MKTYLLMILMIAIAGCDPNSKGTSTGNPVRLNIQSYSSSLAGKVGSQAVTDLKFCFKRLRFKTASSVTNPDPTQDSDNIDLNLGEVTISSQGTTLGEVTVPEGIYSRVEFDLEDNCSGLSARVVNSNGVFQTTERIQIKFEGTLQVSAGTTVNLDIQAIISALNTVNSDSQIRSKAESVSGSL